MPVTDAYQARVAAGALEPDPAQELAAARLSELAQAVAGWSPGLKAHVLGRPGPGAQGVYIAGDVGRGKSMLMDLFFAEARVSRKRRVHFHAFMLEVHEAIADRRRARGGDPIPKVAKAIADDAWLLCFDELQVTDIADAMILGRLFEELFGRGVTVVATSNRAPDDLYADGINRPLFTPFIDLVKQRMDLIHLDAARDYRLARLEAAPVWHAGPGGRAAFEEAWARLTCGEPEHGEVLRVQGRDVRVQRTAAGAGRFSFSEVCGEALGAADYLAIARRFHTVFLEDVPTLDPARRNEAKRFVTLIDTLYEAKTKLIALAAAEPALLYPDGDGAFEFQRTVSRLMEMRSRDYLAAERV